MGTLSICREKLNMIIQRTLLKMKEFNTNNTELIGLIDEWEPRLLNLSEDDQQD